MKILVFAGSTRANSLHKKLALAASAELRSLGLETTIVNLRDFPMPMYDGDVETEAGLPANSKAFRELVRSHDALAIASPEYNGSFPAVIKNTIDWISRPEAGQPPLTVFHGKKAILLSTSPGPGAGKRGLRHLRELLEMIGVQVLPAQVTIPKGTAAFGPSGELLRDEDRQSLRAAAEELALAVPAEPVQA
jgi:chromate reductase, NAD(P)H dehydrogenase (quinone)